MIVVAYQRTQAGAMKRMAERGRVFSLPMPAPKPVPQPEPAPAPRQDVVVHIASHVVAEMRAAALQAKAWKAEKPVHVATPARQIIAQVVAWHPGITVADVMSAIRTRTVVVARYDAIVAVYENCRMDGRRYSLPELGRAFGGRDHTTILHALRKRGIATVHSHHLS